MTSLPPEKINQIKQIIHDKYNEVKILYLKTVIKFINKMKTLNKRSTFNHKYVTLFRKNLPRQVANNSKSQQIIPN